VTTNITLNFLSRPQPGDILGTVQLMKIGRRQVTADMAMRSSDGTLVAHAIATYARPTKS
jgi:acyl-coenzyme A thioesterase PaaI-like protein